MKLTKKLKLFSLGLAFLAVPFVAGMYMESVSAHEGEDHGATAQAQTTQSQPQTNNQKPAAEAGYAYVAQAGDSYTLMARKAVQTYGLKNKVTLSRAQIVYAETMVTQAAHSPFLNQGQKVTIKESVVKDWVDKAGKLTAAQKRAWTAYTAGVNFNTNSVGQNT
jgi:hypothetical protein